MYSSSNTHGKRCPNNEGYVLNWNYLLHGAYIATDDVYIKCAYEDNFCTSENPCGSDQGDCDTHDECQDGLLCGSNNCPDSLDLHSEFDCCYAPACCPTLNVLLENDVKDIHGDFEGVYTFQGFIDGMDYWVDAEGENAIWYTSCLLYTSPSPRD